MLHEKEPFRFLFLCIFLPAAPAFAPVLPQSLHGLSPTALEPADQRRSVSRALCTVFRQLRRKALTSFFPCGRHAFFPPPHLNPRPAASPCCTVGTRCSFAPLSRCKRFPPRCRLHVFARRLPCSRPFPFIALTAAYPDTSSAQNPPWPRRRTARSCRK